MRRAFRLPGHRQALTPLSLTYFGYRSLPLLGRHGVLLGPFRSYRCPSLIYLQSKFSSRFRSSMIILPLLSPSGFILRRLARILTSADAVLFELAWPRFCQTLAPYLDQVIDHVPRITVALEVRVQTNAYDMRSLHPPFMSHCLSDLIRYTFAIIQLSFQNCISCEKR